MTSNLGPTTATVVDFICLFTHDLKRKQKRWQDGILKYHTFNKRVMVYDDRSHFIGDAHWQGGGDLEPGDEFELDRGSAIVQVSDCTGQREQDLTELLDKRAKEVEKRRTNAGIRTPGSTAAVTQTPRNDQNAPHFQLRYRPLNDLVGGSSSIGRAVVSPHSPYEVRKMAESTGQQQDSPSEEARPSKRRRQEDSPPSKMGHARALFGTTLTLTPFSSSMPLARSQTLQERGSTGSKVLSSSTKDDPSNALQHIDRSSRSPPPPSKSKETEANAPRPSAPRRVLTQRASLKELLVGNEHNRTREPPRLREVIPRNRANILKHTKPQSSDTDDNVVSLISQEPKPQKRHVDPVPKTSRNAQRSREADAGRSNSFHMPAREVAETRNSNQGKEQSADPSEDAFLSWLVQSESTASAHRTPVSPTSKRLGRSKRSSNDTTSTHKRSVRETVQKVVQEPIVIDEDEEASSALIQPKIAASESSKIKVVNRSEPRGTKRALAADKASTMETDADKPPPAKEPRTELRIRSRQRRGLLVIAQNKQGNWTGSTARSLPSSSGVDSDALTTPLPIVDSVSTLGESELAQKNAAEKDISEKEPKRQTLIISSDSSIPTLGPATQSAKDPESNQTEATLSKDMARDTYKDTTKDPNTGCEDAEPLQQSDDVVGPNSDKISVNNLPGDEALVTPPRRRTNPSRRSRQKAAQAILSDDEDEIGADDSLSKSDNEKEDSSAKSEPDRKPEPKLSSGPRITKMSRKSVKSREILGFVMPPEDFPTAGFNVAHNDPTEAKKPIDNSSTVERPSEGVENAQSMAHEPETVQPPTNENKSQTKQPARIVNPATRGRKAARKQDAAGLPPQPLVQLAPTTDSRVVLATPFKTTTPAAAIPQSELPGFCKANGGAWSRHAEDLLGMTRPSKGPSRR
ncbi:uncharacterized protein FTOL_08256 [Fusarium torulosum]|uniref:5'-3' DNA helicase ZGRF1-like N-terminal domain-containing protein n=1 Tax=Fusarium torulosum TaxID=33205 RepID=A0AAE8MDP6_9HYPO|nr:uncharacterized protein FTOL_08256 [Fusarium torulosum]